MVTMPNKTNQLSTSHPPVATGRSGAHHPVSGPVRKYGAWLLRVAAVLVIVSLGVTVAGCGPRRKTKLTDAMKEFTQGFRWGRTDMAVAYFTPDLTDLVQTIMKATPRIDVLNYELGAIRYGDEEKSASTQVMFTWRIVPEVTTRDGLAFIKWIYNEDGVWQVESFEGPFVDEYRRMADAPIPGKADDGVDQKTMPKVYQRKADF
jgi:hypothetical protein